MLTPTPLEIQVQRKLEEQNQKNHDMIRISDLFTKVFSEFQHVMHNRGLIARCESLPVVKGSESAYQSALSGLVSLILHIGKGDGPVFLHIDCRKLTSQELSSPGNTSHKTVFVRMHTNLDCSTNIESLYAQEISKIRDCLTVSGATLIIEQSGQSGCFFNIAVPAK